MRISSVNNYQNNLYSPSFGVNPDSKKLRFKSDDFFVKIKGYGTNSDWAQMIIHTADVAVKFIRNNFDFESILRFITAGVKKANQIPKDVDKRNHSGILRAPRKNWEHGSDWKNGFVITHYDGYKSKYKSYSDRLDKTVRYPLKNPYKNFMLTRPVHSFHYGKMLEHAEPRFINGALDKVGEMYNDLHKKYIEKEVTKNDMEDINASIAEIRWILAHATPWERGSDAISNVFMRALYKSMWIKSYPLKKGISLDLEAFCTPLSEYKKNFSSYFEASPKVMT